MSSKRRKLGISLSDQVALLALGGIIASAGIWLAFAYTDSVMAGTPYVASLLTPDEQHLIVRLAAIVVVLIATLVIEMGYTRSLRAEQRLLHEQARIRQMYDRSPDAILSIAPDFAVEYANPRVAEYLARSTTDVLGTVCHESIFACDAPCDGCLAGQVFETGQVAERTFVEHAGGQRRFLEQVFFPVLDIDGKVESVVESSRDVTAVRMAQEALRRSNEELEEIVTLRTTDLIETNDALEAEIIERQRTADALADSENRYRALIESSPDMVLVHRDGRIAFLNATGAKLMGFSSPSEALGLPVAILIEPNGSGYTPEELLGAVGNGDLSKPVHVKLRRANGELIDVELSVSPMTFERDSAVQCIVRDISERVRAQETIQRMAYYDPLTDLPNRALLRDRLGSALAQARRRTETVAVVFVDLDDFKAINDTLGHGVGDGVLKAVSQQIRGVLREEDTVARQGGDEFTIIARVASRDDAGTLAERVLESIGGPFEVDGHQLRVSASIGIATYPHDGDRDVDLIRNADAAMYRAKEWGHNVYRLYTPEMSESAAGRLELESAMREALERDEFELYYQPQVDVRDGSFVGVEALLRWNHPTRDMLSPGDFIELAEQAGFIGEIGHWALQTACEQATLWLAEGLEFGRVAVNLSAREFVQRNIVENVARALESTGLDASMLELEITETIAMYNVEQILAILQLLRNMGVRVAIDDFGTGYSSMSYLKRFPVQTLKIAQDFMRDVDVDSQSAAIASMLIELCRELDLDIVAEGVENQRQLEFLRERGCYVIQGYLFSRPVSAGELGDILRNGAEAQWAAAGVRAPDGTAE
jgi:diguanylate cyclase (GGDEF)-like protein/PAS domain S-box-containing protein